MINPPSQKVPDVIRIYLTLIKHFIRETKRIELVDRVTGPAIYTIGQSWSALFNVYPLSNDLSPEVFKRLVQIAKQFTTIIVGGKGELISVEVGKGKILDMGEKYFEILKGHIFECYQYENESFAYIRVFQEKKMDNEEVWISFDMDFLEKSAWFKEKITIQLENS
ncbi:MAG: hypothetical protein ACE5I5_05000 [Candidatus Heimdallarchaeota archaeon]